VSTKAGELHTQASPSGSEQEIPAGHDGPSRQAELEQYPINPNNPLHPDQTSVSVARRCERQIVARRCDAQEWPARAALNHSHSIVAGGLELTSYTTRFTPGIWLINLLEIRPSTSYGNGYQSAVIPSVLVTARRPSTFS
jgi:hypothetical protein